MIAAIIPTLDEAEHIGALLDQLTSDPTPELAEILVVDGGSTDATRDIVQAAARLDQRIRLLDNPARLQSAGVNIGARAADPSVDVLIRLDAHAAYPPRFISALSTTLAATEADSVAVRLTSRGVTCFQRAVAAASNSVVGTGGAAHRVGGKSGWTDHGHHAAFRRSSFRAIGGYDESFRANEDAEFDARLRAAGGRIWFASQLEVQYFPRATPAALARQYFRYGWGRAQNVLKNRQVPRLRQIIPPAGVLVLVGSLLIIPLFPWTAAIPAAYAALMCLAAIWLAWRNRDWCVLGLALAAPIIHLAWACGFFGGAMVGSQSRNGERCRGPRRESAA